MNNRWIINLIDESASMQSIKNELVDSYNNFIHEMKNLESDSVFILDGIQYNDIKWTTYTFNNKTKLLVDNSIKNINSLKLSDYKPSNGTALLDSIGNACIKILSSDNIYNSIVLNIFTDGLENSSKIYSYQVVNELLQCIKNKQSININFYCTTDECLQVIDYLPSVDTKYSSDIRNCMRQMSQQSQTPSYEMHTFKRQKK
jgi:hypothetical protein